MNFSKRDEIIFYGYHGRYNGNAKVLYEYYLTIDNGLNPIWLLDNRDCNLDIDENKSFILPSKIASTLEHLKFLFKLHKARVIVVTSVGDLHIYRMLLWKKNHVEILLPHGISLKLNGIMAKHLEKEQKKIWLSIPKRFDMISVASRIDKYSISSGLSFDPNKIKIIGPQRRDVQSNLISLDKKLEIQKSILSNTNLNIKENEINDYTFILYAPTHRDHKKNSIISTLLSNIDGFDMKKLNAFLEKNRIILFLREHMESQNNLNNNESDLSSVRYLSQVDVPNIDYLLYGFDLLITDYSSIYLDLIDYDISIAFIPYDLDEYEEKRGLTLAANTFFIGPSLLRQEEFISYLENRKLIDKKYIEKRKYLTSLLFEIKVGESCKMTVKEINKLINLKESDNK
jgi:CDP-glycerol glycerophosphotransferase